MWWWGGKRRPRRCRRSTRSTSWRRRPGPGRSARCGRAGCAEPRGAAAASDRRGRDAHDALSGPLADGSGDSGRSRRLRASSRSQGPDGRRGWRARRRARDRRRDRADGGIDFPFPGYLNNIVRQIALRFTPPERDARLRAEIMFLIHRDGRDESELHHSFRIVSLRSRGAGFGGGRSFATARSVHCRMGSTRTCSPSRSASIRRY
jgi:hypothetical protein